MLPTRRPTQALEPFARSRVDSEVALRAATPAGLFDDDEELSTSDVERRHAYAAWLSRFEPAEQPPVAERTSA